MDMWVKQCRHSPTHHIGGFFRWYKPLMPGFSGPMYGQDMSGRDAIRPGCHILGYKKLWNDRPCSMGKSTISTGPFSIAM
jgi:hypothetical protein